MADQLDLLQDKMPSKQMASSFEGASHVNRELAMWHPPLRSADAEIIPGKDEIDARALDLQRNDGYIHGAVQGQKDSIVGAFYRLNSKPNYKYLGLDEVWAEEFQEAVEAQFSLAAESPDCYFDAAGQLTFSEMIRLSIGVSMLAGEDLSTVEWIREGRRPFKTAIQMIDPVRLSNPYGEEWSTTWRKGVRKDSRGRPVDYSIRYTMPGDNWDFENEFRWKIVAARKPWGRKQVLHYFEPYRVGQTRGVSDLVSILKQSKMVGKYQDIVLQNAVLNATYAAAIESDLPPSEAFEALGGGEDQIQKWAQNYLESIAAYTGNSKNLHIDGIKIPHLYPGTKLKLQNAGQPGGLGTGFEESLLRHLAAGLGMSYEEFSHDFTKTNYSSARAAMGETHKRLQGRKKAVADKKATDIFRLWFEEQLNSGAFNDVLPRNAPNFYERLNADAYCACSWIGAPRGQIDELKETQAAIARIEAGLSTYEKEAARFGEDFREVFRQRQREQNLADELGLTLNTKGSSGTMDAGGNAANESPKRGGEDDSDE
ncbi:phage portal protein [Marinobacter nauticus]|uniref:phage portal protein n=1 Tax=Marinobacter nauticus TaxID=2743 RepID=UPI0037364B16